MQTVSILAAICGAGIAIIAIDGIARIGSAARISVNTSQQHIA
jgi:hypothetical protein